MADKPDGVPGDAGRAGSAGGGPGPAAPARPHATIDVKATEIPEPSQVKSGDEARTASAKPQEQKADAKRKPGPGTPVASGGGASAAGRVLSHLLAGFVGGAVVLGANQTLAPKPAVNTLDAASARVRVAEHEERLQAIETALKQGAPDAPLAARTADIESRLEKVDELARSVAASSDAQGKIAGEIQALSERTANSEADRERITKLEERLSLMASAEPGAGEGRLPQLAALTGKIAEIEERLGMLRNDLIQDMDGRLKAAAQAGEDARSGSQRLERDLAALKADIAKIAQRTDASKAESDGFAANVKSLQANADKLAGSIGELRGTVESALKAAAKPADVAAAVAPLSAKLAALDKSIEGVVRNEEERKADTRRIVLALELANLKRRIDQGQGYAAELERVRAVAGDAMDFSSLERHKSAGIPALPDLEREFRGVLAAVLDADAEPADGSVFDRLIAGAKSVVRVRKINHTSGETTTEAVLARMEAALDQGRIVDVIEEANAIPPGASAPLQDWLDKVKARHAAEQAIAAVEAELKASLSADGAPAAASGN